MSSLITRQLPPAPDTIAPDGSAVRLLAAVPRGSMAHFTLPPGAVTRAVAHRTVEEVWFFVGGRGRMWRRLGGGGEAGGGFPRGIGGDAFFLIAQPGKKPRAIDACGAAGSLATMDRYEKAGYDFVPPRGVYGALTVPGAVSGWTLALELSAALGGRLTPRDLLAT